MHDFVTLILILIQVSNFEEPSIGKETLPVWAYVVIVVGVVLLIAALVFAFFSFMLGARCRNR